MEAFVQDNTKHVLNGHGAALGLYERGFYVTRCSTPIHALDFHNPAVYGNVNFVEEYLTAMKYNIRSIGHVPSDLTPYAGREITYMTLGEALKLENVFIKPIPEKHKRFTGIVIDSSIARYKLQLETHSYDIDEQVIVSPVINIASEWRGFVCEDELIDCKHYKGDFRIAPDYSIEKHITEWKDRPSAWSCDFGITDTGETIIVECNDVMSLGWYGLVPAKIGRMLEVRWEEIHKNKST